MSAPNDRAEAFRHLHDPSAGVLVLPNAWDAASARLVEDCGAPAVATTSAGLAWSHGFPDGGALPPRVLAAAVAEIARVLSVPLTIDVEHGYSDDLAAVADTIAAVIDAGAVGVNIEDGASPPDLLCAKIETVKSTAARRGVELFVNARADVFLRAQAPGREVEETTLRERRYRSAGADGLFVPLLAKPEEIAAIVAAVALPLNVMVCPGLPRVAELQSLGVRRVSAGAAIARAALGAVRRAATGFLREGTYDALLSGGEPSSALNVMMPR